MADVQHVFIIGSKGLGNYGGYETFVNKLTDAHKNNSKIKYHIACKQNGKGYMNEKKLENIISINNNQFEYHNADCIKIHVPEKIGSAQAIYYDLAALNYFASYCYTKGIDHPIFYVLACRIGPFVGKYKRKINNLGGLLFVNPDGHEWLREKWSWPVRKYWKKSESRMVKYADLLVCDSINIEQYIKNEYTKYNPKTTYIAYGSDIVPSNISNDDPKFLNWLKNNKLEKNDYYLIVGRFVPENNFETMIREFMESNSEKNLVIISTKDDKYSNKLNDKLQFKKDSRIKFIGTIYDSELLKKIRENAYGYLHGHSVGGTNPSLLEALGSTKLNLLFDVGFNREVAKNAAFYWNKNNGNLAKLINITDCLDGKTIEKMGEKAKQRIRSSYNWQYIADRYEQLFTIK